MEMIKSHVHISGFLNLAPGPGPFPKKHIGFTSHIYSLLKYLIKL